MKTKLISLGGGSYVTPEVISFEIVSEGLLCASTDAVTIKNWEEDSESLNF